MAFKSTAMSACNAAVLFILVCTFTAVCQADDFCSISCEDVTGTVGEEVTFTCSVSQCSDCCIKLYKFQYKDSEICRQEFPLDSCKRRNSFTCRYTPTTAMTKQFRFYFQTMCGIKATEFTVVITETPSSGEDHGSTAENSTGSHGTVVASVVSCFIIIIIIITMTIIYKRKSNSSTPHGVQKWTTAASKSKSQKKVIHITGSTV